MQRSRRETLCASGLMWRAFLRRAAVWDYLAINWHIFDILDVLSLECSKRVEAGKLTCELQLRIFSKKDDKPIQVIEHVYIGSVAAAKNRSELKALGITHIVNARCDPSWLQFWPRSSLFASV